MVTTNSKYFCSCLCGKWNILARIIEIQKKKKKRGGGCHAFFRIDIDPAKPFTLLQTYVTIHFVLFVLSFFYSEAEVLDHSKTPCTNKRDFVPSTKDKTYVFYIRMNHGSDWTTWNNVARCLKIWDLDSRGFHKSMWRMWLNENHVLIVGCPASLHCVHKPSSIDPIYIQNQETRPQ